MAQYQSFPDASGDSRTLEKLKSLQLPDLNGRTFLDVGCNEGFFCGFAKFAGASRAVGVDNNDEFLRRARARFPDCEFLVQGWDRLPDGMFDVILLASALHYADDQPALIRRLVDALAPGGVLVVELGIFRSDKPEWITVKRGIDQRQFPTMPLLASLLDDYAWKWVGPSVRQSGDPVPRHVVHVSRRHPLAYLLLQPPASGKTSIARHLFPAAGVKVVSGDAVLLDIALGKSRVPEKLRKAVQAKYSALAADQTVRRIFEKGHAAALVQAWLATVDGGDLAIDAFVPAEYHAQVEAALADAGYLPVQLDWKRPALPLMGSHALASQADAFYRSLGEAEPPPSMTFADAAGAAGYVDAVVAAPGAIEIRGWAIDENGVFPSQLVVGVGADRIIVDTGTARVREDVKRHLKCTHAQLGYSITLQGAEVQSLAELGRRGFTVSLVSGRPLRVALSVQKALANAGN
ncbi:MAG TPA: methyltransferase domain-containing protein [Rhodanobacteraceae bacterium]|nr:methyltransferase domain-containing protein [Rhodanobacteraceae bacterium]